jgi:small subunit ribosomal protein S20
LILTETDNSDRCGVRKLFKGGCFLANHKSAEKRDRQDVKRLQRNRAIKASVRTAVKAVRETIGGQDSETAAASLAKAIPVIAKAAARGTIHKNNAARKISRLTKLVNSVKS